MEGEEFNPRTAALRYAAEATAIVRGDPTTDGAAAAAATNAFACALVYVGDEIEELRHLLRDALPSAGRGN